MQPTIFKVEIIDGKYILNYDGGSCSWDNQKIIKDFLKDWLKEHKNEVFV